MPSSADVMSTLLNRLVHIISTAVIYGVLRCLTICLRTDRSCQSHHRLLSVCVRRTHPIDSPSPPPWGPHYCIGNAYHTLYVPHCRFGSPRFCSLLPPNTSTPAKADCARQGVVLCARPSHNRGAKRAGDGRREPGCQVAAGHQASGLGRNCQGASKPPRNCEQHRQRTSGRVERQTQGQATTLQELAI